MRPEVNIEAVIEAGRVILPKKYLRNLKEAATASKMLRRHTVGSSCANRRRISDIMNFFFQWRIFYARCLHNAQM